MNKPKAIQDSYWSDSIWLMISTLVVNVGNYVFNVLTGRILSPAAFGEANFVVTAILAISFVATAFQLTAAKFADPKGQLNHIAWLFGLLLALALLMGSTSMAHTFQLSNEHLIYPLVFIIPFYFALSVGRGQLQGALKMRRFAATYQVEMWVRLVIGVGLVILTQSVWGVVIGLTFSVIVSFGFTLRAQNFPKNELQIKDIKGMSTFFVATLMYEFSQIAINNSDVLIVKHYFNTHDAGLYAALALIGRVVYFGTWSVVMVLFPKVVALKKQGLATHHLLFKSFTLIVLMATLIVLVCALFPEWLVGMLFGQQYLTISTYLWQYAALTALFACANVWVYYHLSLDRKMPIFLSFMAGIMQFLLLMFWHNNFDQVIQGQCIAMLFLFISLLVYHSFIESPYSFFVSKKIQLS